MCAKNAQGEDVWVKMTFQEEINALTKSLNILNPLVRRRDIASKRNENCIETLRDVIGLDDNPAVLLPPETADDYTQCGFLGLESGELTILDCLASLETIIGRTCLEGLNSGELSILERLENVIDSVCLNDDGTYSVPVGCSTLVDGSTSVCEAICQVADQVDINTTDISNISGAFGGGGGGSGGSEFEYILGTVNSGVNGNLDGSGNATVSFNLDPTFDNSESVQLKVNLRTFATGVGVSNNGNIRLYDLIVNGNNYGEIAKVYWNTSGGEGEDTDTVFITVDTRDIVGPINVQYKLNTTITGGGGGGTTPGTNVSWEVQPVGRSFRVTIPSGTGHVFVGTGNNNIYTDTKNAYLPNSGSQTFGPFDLTTKGVPPDAVAVQIKLQAHMAGDNFGGNNSYVSQTVKINEGGPLPITITDAVRADHAYASNVSVPVEDSTVLIIDVSGAGAVQNVKFTANWNSGGGGDKAVGLRFRADVIGYFVPRITGGESEWIEAAATFEFLGLDGIGTGAITPVTAPFNIDFGAAMAPGDTLLNYGMIELEFIMQVDTAGSSETYYMSGSYLQDPTGPGTWSSGGIGHVRSSTQSINEVYTHTAFGDLTYSAYNTMEWNMPTSNGTFEFPVTLDAVSDTLILANLSTDPMATRTSPITYAKFTGRMILKSIR
jgi:hypothetical protein